MLVEKDSAGLRESAAELLRLAEAGDHEDRQLALIDALRTSGRTQAVRPLVWRWTLQPRVGRNRVRGGDTGVGIIAGAGAASLVGRASPTQLSMLGQQLRQQGHPSDPNAVFGFSRGWFTVTPDRVGLLASVGEDRANALGLLSEHPSGHVRERAVRALEAEPITSALKFILLRLND